MEETPATPLPIEPPPPPENPQPLAVSTIQPPTITTPSHNPNLTPTTITVPKPPISPKSQTGPTFSTRPWQQPPQSHFSLPSPPLPSSSSAPVSASSIASRGGMAIGVPAHHSSSAQPPPASFSSLASPSYGSQQSQIRQPMQGMGMTGTFGTTSAMRPIGVPAHQLRPSQSIRPQQGSTTSQSPVSQNFQVPGMLRISAMGSPLSPSPSSTQNQPWLSSGTGAQGKPPMPTTSFRPQTSFQSFQQRSHISQQQHHNKPTSAQQHPVSSNQQPSQFPASGQPQENYAQQFPSSRMQQSIIHQQQITRGPGLESQRGPPGVTHSGASGALHLSGPNKTATAENEEASNRIVTKRSIQDLVNQIDPSEKLDPEVEDILADIAEDFVETITSFGCSLAKHRKSSTLEAKDILLHLERNWNLSLPGFGGDEIKIYKKPFVSDIHRERLAAIRKSSVATDMTIKSLGGQSGGNAKDHLARGSTIGSPPNPKIHEVV